MKLLILGDGGQASWAEEIAHKTSFEPVKANLENQKSLIEGGSFEAFIVAIGDNYKRQTLYNKIRKEHPALLPKSLIHPSAEISSTAQVGEGSLIMPKAVLGPQVEVGMGFVCYSGSVIEHDSTIEDFVCLGSLAAVSGGVKIGARTFVGAGAALKHGVNLGKDVVVASGANVTQDFKEPAVVASLSSPASVLRERKEGDDYL